MPLVLRKIKVVNDTTTMSEEMVDHVAYVAPDKVGSGDIIVEPSSPRQLAELAELYPDEYGEKAEAEGVSSESIDATAPGRAGKIVAMNAKEAIAEINDLDEDKDSALLWSIFELENARGEDEDDPAEYQPRATVLAALERKGVTDGDGPE